MKGQSREKDDQGSVVLESNFSSHYFFKCMIAMQFGDISGASLSFEVFGVGGNGGGSEINENSCLASPSGQQSDQSEQATPCIIRKIGFFRRQIFHSIGEAMHETNTDDKSASKSLTEPKERVVEHIPFGSQELDNH